MGRDRKFADRSEAGIALGKRLADDYKGHDPLVLGIPRGGVLVAYEVAKILNASMSVIITKKLPHPLHDELAIGAIAEDGSAYLSPLGKALTESTLNRIVKAQRKEIDSRIQRFRQGKALPEIQDRNVVIVDDGIATGSTILPAILLCKKQNASTVTVASPVSGEKYVSEMTSVADSIIVLEQPDYFSSVGQIYHDFHDLSDEEVIRVLEDFSQPQTI
jgi:putative phosphoribosyl transferase